MFEEDEFNAFELPERTKEEIIDKISSLATQIRMDWSDPRGECRKIKELCEKLKNKGYGKEI
jgi:hypothetical protein